MNLVNRPYRGNGADLDGAKAASLAAAMLGLFVLLAPYLNPPAQVVVEKKQLVSLSGPVESVSESAAIVSCHHQGCRPYYVHGERAHVRLIVDVPGRNAYADAFLQDPAVASRLFELKAGEHVDMLVDDHGGESTVWEVSRRGDKLLSYEQTLAYVESTFGNSRAGWLRLIGLGLIVLSIVIWVFFTGTGSLAEDEASVD